MKFKHLKPGDLVYVVDQPSRYRAAKGKYLPVTKIGRQYGYVARCSEPEPFDLTTGQSHHKPNHNQRDNGHGFDVYLAEDEYLTAERNTKNLYRLQTIFRELSYGRFTLAPETVEKCLELLDQQGAAKAE